MASILPSKQSDLIIFGQAHLEKWAAIAATIGLTAGEVGAVEPMLVEAQERALAATNARLAAAAATVEQNNSSRQLRTGLASLVRKVKDFAESSDNPATVYALAEIPSPATPVYNVPPNRPFELSAELDYQTGFLAVRWKAVQPVGINGVVYIIERSFTGATGSFTQVGAVGTKAFVDTQVPAGSPRIIYQLIAQRGNLRSGYSNTLQINFGVGGAGFSSTFTTAVGPSTEETASPAGGEAFAGQVMGSVPRKKVA